MAGVRRTKIPRKRTELEKLALQQATDAKAQRRGVSASRDRRPRARIDVEAIVSDNVATVPPPPQRHDAGQYTPSGYQAVRIKGQTHLMRASRARLSREQLDPSDKRLAESLSTRLGNLTGHPRLSDLRKAMATLDGLLHQPRPAARWRGMLERCLEGTARDRAEERLRTARAEKNETAPRTGAQILSFMEQHGAPPPGWVTARRVDAMIPLVGLSGGGPGGKKAARNLIADAERLQKKGKSPKR